MSLILSISLEYTAPISVPSQSPRIHPEAPAALEIGGKEACIPVGTHTTPVGPWVPALPNWAWVRQSPKRGGGRTQGQGNSHPPGRKGMGLMDLNI